LRWRLIPRLAADAAGDVDRQVAIAVGTSVASGLAHGAAAWLFFPQLDLLERALVTMFMMSWAAGAVQITAGYLPSFIAYFSTSVLPLALTWAVVGGLPGHLVWMQALLPLSLLMFGVVQARFAAAAQRLFRSSFSYRLEAERQRDRANEASRSDQIQRERAEQANRAKSRFLASASHDLRQPLHTLVLFSAALQERARTPADQEIVGHMMGAINALRELLDGLLDISRIDAGVIQPERSRFDLASVADQVADEYAAVAARKGLRLVSRVPLETLVFTDRLLLTRIVRNLVDNAIKYSERGEVVIDAAGPADALVLQISDQGVGIPGDELEKVFQEFYQLDNPGRDRERGLGLGLSIVSGLSELLGIRVRLTSQLGQGTTVHLQLPAQPSVAGLPSPAQAPPTPATLHGVRVLVVEDDLMVQRATRTLLESLGCRVELAASVAAAAHCAAAGEIDVVLADYRLGAESGLQAVQAVRKYRPEVHAVLVTGDTGAREIREVSDSGLRMLSKPVDALELKRALARQ
jgi:signal transduction histidine kinase/CheY-like chemotaxis protein